MSPEITWLGVGMALVITGAILISYRLGIEVGKQRGVDDYIADAFGLYEQIEPGDFYEEEDDELWER